MKRKHVDLTKADRYGHWWFEIGEPSDPTSESYGWWPRDPVTAKQTVRGLVGELNGQTNFGGEPSRDPHHGDRPNEEFHPWVLTSVFRTDEQVADCLRQFALAYLGEWRWALGKGQNCHSFQVDAMRHCRLRRRPTKSGN